jgi:tetratricopeptide (TPR) repeat protein
MFSKLLLIMILAMPTAFASYESAEKSYSQGSISLSGYRRTIIELVKGGYHYSVIPWMKDFLTKGKGALDSEMEAALDTMLEHTGVKIFESLPETILQRSNSPNIRYILAKRLFNREKYNEALDELKNVSIDHSSYPFVANFRGVIHAAIGKPNEALTDFNDCIRGSEKRAAKVNSSNLKSQLEANRDYCISGIARVQFAAKDFKKAELNYLDVSKESYVWPEILFEEAWTSYYLKNYNRTLGKLVSYRAPVFDFIFKPEIEVLKALTYLKMCLFEDAKRTVDGFYNDLLNPANELRRFILSKGKNYRYYFELIADHESGKSMPLPIIEQILKSVRKDPAFIELKGSMAGALAEYNQLRNKSNGSMKVNLSKNLQTVVDEYRNTIGSYARTGLTVKYAELYSAFQGMSYIKLEVLAQRKEKLYQSDIVQGGKRGDVQYIQKNDKQYFWTFNGEFWADELGDYVFALRSEC